MPAKEQPLWKGFVTGSLGSMAGGAASHPLDLIKVRMQIQGEAVVGEAAVKKLSPIGMGVSIVKTQVKTLRELCAKPLKKST